MGGLSSIQIFFGFLEFLTLQSPLGRVDILRTKKDGKLCLRDEKNAAFV